MTFHMKVYVIIAFAHVGCRTNKKVLKLLLVCFKKSMVNVHQFNGLSNTSFNNSKVVILMTVIKNVLVHQNKFEDEE